MTYDGLAHQTLLAYPEIRDRLILLDGASKTYAMTGWRLGWSVWPQALYDNARKLAVNSFSCTNAATQFAGVAALEGPQEAVHSMVAEFDRRRRIVVDGLNRLPGHFRRRRRKARSTLSPTFPARDGRRRSSLQRCSKRSASRRSAARISACTARAICVSPMPTRPRTSSPRWRGSASSWRRARRHRAVGKALPEELSFLERGRRWIG